VQHGFLAGVEVHSRETHDRRVDLAAVLCRSILP
jgi:hypothetical protein